MANPQKRALITGITGQDGSYLAEFLLEQGYEVYGLVRRVSNPSDQRIAHLQHRLRLLPGDLLDQTSLERALESIIHHFRAPIAAIAHAPVARPRATVVVTEHLQPSPAPPASAAGLE